MAIAGSAQIARTIGPMLGRSVERSRLRVPLGRPIDKFQIIQENLPALAIGEVTVRAAADVGQSLTIIFPLISS